MQRTIAERERAIVRITTPLPGSEPYDNNRPINISARHDGKTLLDTLCSVFPQLPPDHWHERLAQGLLTDLSRRPVTAEQQVRAGERYLHRTPFMSEPDVAASIRVLHEDEAIVVIDKPAPLPLHPSGRYNRNTLQAILNRVYHPQKLRPIHRLDANTTGIVVFARTRHFARLLQPQFAVGNIEKHYVARIQGLPPQDGFACDAPIGNCATELGARQIDEEGSAAQTEFQVVDRFADRTALVEARPLTGRTNQIRLHLWHLGWPICGDQAYLPNRQIGDTQTHQLGDPPLCLHALRISFEHPITKERVTFQCTAPSWANGPNPTTNMNDGLR
jgi:RluA family pseudouridine synthase